MNDEKKQNEVEELTLAKAAQYLLDESRMVLPGMQALFGFQLIAVFNESFQQKLSSTEQTFHLVALLLVATAIALVMTPAAMHRQTGARHVTNRFIEKSTRLLLLSMFPLLFAVCIDLFLIARIITNSFVNSLLISIGIFAIYVTLWFVFPRSVNPRIPQK